MSWLPDPTKFLRRSYRKGADGDHQEKPAKNKGAAKAGSARSSSKHSSLYSLMQASSNPSLERSAEDDNPSMHEAIESSTSNMDGSLYNTIFIDPMVDASSSHSNGDHVTDTEVALIQHAANILISHVPASSQVHVHHSPHGIKDPHASHFTQEYPSASQVLHETRVPLAEDESSKKEEPLSAKQGTATNVIARGFSFAAPVNSENEHTDGSECKVISEDLAASRAPWPPDHAGKTNSTSTSTSSNATIKEKRKGKGNREQYVKRKSPVAGERIKSLAPEKTRQSNSRRTSSQKGQGKKSSNSKKSPHAEQTAPRQNPKMEKETRAPISPPMPHPSFAQLVQEDSELGMVEPARISIGRDVPDLNSKKRSPISMAGQRSESNSPLRQHQQSFSFQEIEFLEDKARASVSHEARPEQRSPLMTGHRESKSPSLVPAYQALSLQDSETMGDRERVSMSHDTTEIFRTRSPLMVARKDPNSPVLLLHQDFSLQDHEMMSEQARISASYDSVELGSRRQSPLMMAAQRDLLNFPSTLLHQISSSAQAREMKTGETARGSIDYEAAELIASRRQSPLTLTRRQPSSSLTPRQPYSLRDHEMIRERGRISVGGDEGQELGLRRQISPFMGARNKPNSPLMQHHNFLLPDTEERARSSVSRDGDLALGSSRPNPFAVPRRDQSKPPPKVSSERFYFQEDEFMRSVYDRPPSPFLASQASLSRERGGSVYVDDIPSLPLPASQRFFLQKDDSGTGQYYEPNSPLIASQHYILQEDQRASNKPISPYLSRCKNLSHEAEGIYTEGVSSPMLSHHGFYSQDDGYDDDIGSANKRSSFYYEGRQGGSISRDNYRSPLMSQRRETLDISMLSNEPFLMQESEEALYHEQLAVESNDFIGDNVFFDDYDAKRGMLLGDDETVTLVPHSMRSTAEMQSLPEEEDRSELQLIQEEEDQLSPLYADVLSEDLINSSYSKKQRSKEEPLPISPLSENSRKSYSMRHTSKGGLINKAEALSSAQSPLSEASSSISSGKRMMKKLEEAQAEIAVVRHARRGFEEMVVEMVGSGAAGGEDDYAVQNLLDLEEFVGGYECLSSSCAIFKGVVDQFFHELCCELLQPVSHEDDPVLSMALLRLQQLMCSSPSPSSIHRQSSFEF